MLLEGLVAILALSTLMILPKGDPGLSGDPNLIYARGLTRYLGLIGINPVLALTFALLAFSTFVYDTLDVATRLARYVMQELLGWKTFAGATFSTFLTLLLPLFFLLTAKEKAYLIAWPIFGTTNQLLASLTLMAISVWLYKTGQKIVFVAIPLLIMMTMSVWSLLLYTLPFLRTVFSFDFSAQKGDTVLIGLCGLIMTILTVGLLIAAGRQFLAGRQNC